MAQEVGRGSPCCDPQLPGPWEEKGATRSVVRSRLPEWSQPGPSDSKV